MNRRWVAKEVSWLGFNARLLEEAADSRSALLERIRFLDLYSSNLQDYISVRVAALKRREHAEISRCSHAWEEPAKVMEEVRQILSTQQGVFDETHEMLVKALARAGVFVANQGSLSGEHAAFVRDYFSRSVRPLLGVHSVVGESSLGLALRDQVSYLAIADSAGLLALLSVPTGLLPGYVELPTSGGNRFVISVENVIRHNLGAMFGVSKPTAAFAVQLTRDSTLDFDGNSSKSSVQAVSEGLERRQFAAPVCLAFERAMSASLLSELRAWCNLGGADIELFPRTPHHYFGRLFYCSVLEGGESISCRAPVPHWQLSLQGSVLFHVCQQDALLTCPYQSFDVVLKLMREAAVDESVTCIKMTLYRVAQYSLVVDELLRAARHGKRVVVVLELRARFDEAANIRWSERLQAGGVRVLHGSLKRKVHAKLFLIQRRGEGAARKGVAVIGTGNFNETTAQAYTDHILFTGRNEIVQEVAQLFSYLEGKYSHGRFEHLWVSPFGMQAKLLGELERETRNARRGKSAYVIAKVNNLTDPDVISCLYNAAESGVTVRLMVRGMCSLVADGQRIQACGVVDRYLEHSRVFIFGNGGEERVYLSSADWMSKSLVNRVEVSVPIVDEVVRCELREVLEIQWRDGEKARVLDGTLDNRLSPHAEGPRSQEALYAYFRRKVSDSKNIQGLPSATRGCAGQGSPLPFHCQ